MPSRHFPDPIEAGPIQIYRLPIFTDNYVFVLCHLAHRQAIVVDPGTSESVQALLHHLDLDLTAIWITHHHWDHIGGIDTLKQHYPELPVYGAAANWGQIPGQTVRLIGGEQWQWGERPVQVLAVPGHTLGHLAYYFPPTETAPGDLFCGDTVFGAGCGRLKEGTPAQMWDSLQLIRQLPETTRIWCAHEYTLKNLQFALTVDAANADVQARYQATRQARQANQPTIPSTLGLEKRTNPFLRCDDSQLQRAVSATSGLETFTRLRSQRDQF